MARPTPLCCRSAKLGCSYTLWLTVCCAGSCSTLPDTENDVFVGTEQREIGDLVIVAGPAAVTGVARGGASHGSDTLLLRYQRNPSGDRYELYVITFDPEKPGLFQKASSEDGQTFEVLRVKQEGGPFGLGYREHSVVVIGRDCLEACADKGVHMTLAGQETKVGVSLPGYYIRGFLRKRDEIMK